MKRLILLLLLFSLPAAAEIVDPDGENNSVDFQDNGGTQCDSADCTTHITDDSTATAVCDDTGASGTADIIFTFASPTASPSTGANEQTIQGSVSRHDDANNGSSCAHDSGGNDPTFIIEIYCNGVASGVFIENGTAITGDAQAFSGTFTFGTTIGTATCAADGSDFEIRFGATRSGGSPTARRWAALEELEWDATVSAGATRRRTLF